MSEYTLDKPWTYNDWHVFPHTTMANLDLNDCNDTVNGVCQPAENLQECIKLCEDDPEGRCEWGYFITTPKGEENICVPIYNYTEQQVIPFYLLRQKDYYPELKNLDSTFFFQKSYPYPPDLANGLFYMDNFVLKNINTGMVLGTNEDGKITENVNFSKEDPVSLQFLPTDSARSHVEQYVMIKNGENVAINIPGTSLILRKEGGGEIKWLMRASMVNSEQNTFQIHALSSPNEGLMMHYGLQFYFTYFGQILTYDEKSQTIKLLNMSYEDAIKNKENVLFELIPKIESYYCDRDECKMIELSETEHMGMHARYKGGIASRNPSCWGLCEKKKGGTLRTVIFVVSIVVIVILLLWYFRK